MNAALETTSTALTVLQRAQVALQSEENERKLKELAQASKSITAITNQAGYEQCHASRMTLKKMRVEIERIGKGAREDAQAFSKAVITEQGRLIGLIEPEESRLEGLQKEWDAAKEREKQARIEAERKRLAAITEHIEDIRNQATEAVGESSAKIYERIRALVDLTIDDTFAEFKQQAEGAKATTLIRLRSMHGKAFAAEEDAQRLVQERAAQAAERERLARERAEQEATAAKERARIAEEQRIAREAAAAEAARQAEVLRRQREEQEREAAAERARLAEEARRLEERRRQQETEEQRQREAREAEQQRLANERAELERQQEALRIQQEAVAKPSDPVEATEQEDVKIVVEEGPTQPSDAEIIDAVAEAFEVSAEVAAGWIAEMGICQKSWNSSLSE